MFTGIVEAVGVVDDATEEPSGRRLSIAWPGFASPLGSSISVNGACLTVVEITDTGFAVDVVWETLRRTTLGSLESGSRVNLERAMPATGRFDGHIVQGHVDGVGKVRGIEDEGGSRRMRIEAPASVARYLAEKGSVAVDGVSLTVTDVTAEEFEVALVPHTLRVTTLGERTTGDRVNLEADILAKYVERLMGSRGGM